MPKSTILFSALFCLLAQLCSPATGADAGARLTEQETRWLQAAAPVLAYAQQLHLPIDIVVQPQADANDVPMAMGFEGRRCKLVLSMRGNGDPEAILAGVALPQRGLMIEAMAAHEVGHCWRYAHGVWHALPAGFVRHEDGGTGAASSPDAARLAVLQREIADMRREEGYSDLVALAWTARRHPAQYQAVLSWLETVRTDRPQAHGGHDTLTWVKLARDPGCSMPRPRPSTRSATCGRKDCCGEINNHGRQAGWVWFFR